VFDVEVPFLCWAGDTELNAIVRRPGLRSSPDSSNLAPPEFKTKALPSVSSCLSQMWNTPIFEVLENCFGGIEA
jgi:hypothetical protein